MLMKKNSNMWKSKGIIVKPTSYRDGDSISISHYCFSKPIDDFEPIYFNKAKYVKKWEDAMNEEMVGLSKNET